MKLSDKGHAALAALLRTELFAVEPSGYSGSDSPEALRVRILLAEREGGEAFEVVFEQGTIEAKLYALCGLFMLSRQRYDACVSRLIEELGAAGVRCASGCMVGTRRVSEVVDELVSAGLPSQIARFDDEYWDALRKLRDTGQVETALVGYAARPSSNALALRTLLDANNSPSSFERLYETGTTAGKLYGLIGHCVLQTDRFDDYRRQLLEQSGEETVPLAEGCMVRQVTVRQVVEDIRPGGPSEDLGKVRSD